MDETTEDDMSLDDSELSMEIVDNIETELNSSRMISVNARAEQSLRRLAGDGAASVIGNGPRAQKRDAVVALHLRPCRACSVPPAAWRALS